MRQVNKAVRIEACQADILMNSKAEFHQASLVRVVTINGLCEEQEDQVVVRRGRGGAVRGGAMRGGGGPGRPVRGGAGGQGRQRGGGMVARARRQGQ